MTRTLNKGTPLVCEATADDRRAAEPGFRSGRLGVGTIGAGRVGAVLAAALAGAGHALTGIAAVSEQSREGVAAMLPHVPVLPVPEVVGRSGIGLRAGAGGVWWGMSGCWVFQRSSGAATSCCARCRRPSSAPLLSAWLRPVSGSRGRLCCTREQRTGCERFIPPPPPALFP